MGFRPEEEGIYLRGEGRSGDISTEDPVSGVDTKLFISDRAGASSPGSEAVKAFTEG